MNDITRLFDDIASKLGEFWGSYGVLICVGFYGLLVLAIFTNLVFYWVVMLVVWCCTGGKRNKEEEESFNMTRVYPREKYGMDRWY